MVTPDIAVVERIGDGAAEAVEPFHMDEDAFRVFYDRTARPVWAYLSKLTGSSTAADDLLQESYYRFLRARVTFDNDAHRRNYLFRIATHLAYDRRRRGAAEQTALEVKAREDLTAGPGRIGGGRGAETGPDAFSPEQRSDVRRALARLKPRDRALLWLAYAEGSSHDEIANALGIRARSVRVVLHRARQRFRLLLGIGDADTGRRRR